MSLKRGSNKKHKLLQRGAYWMYNLQTVYPGGLNKEFYSSVLFVFVCEYASVFCAHFVDLVVGAHCWFCMLTNC